MTVFLHSVSFPEASIGGKIKVIVMTFLITYKYKISGLRLIESYILYMISLQKRIFRFGDFVVVFFFSNGQQKGTYNMDIFFSYSVTFCIGISKIHLHLKWHSVFPYFIGHYTPDIFLLTFLF